jgi:starch synthase
VWPDALCGRSMTPPSNSSVLVANPGPLRWMRPMATALADAKLLREYITTVTERETLKRLAASAPGGILEPLRRNLALRQLPDRVPEDRVHRTQALPELVTVAALRAGVSPARLERITVWAGRRFDRSVSRRLQRGDSALIGASVNVALSFRRANQLGIATLLDYPIAHHRFAQRLLQEEASLQPKYAETLQFHALRPEYEARLEREIALADRVIVRSSFQRRTFLEAGIDDTKLVEIPFGVDLELFRPGRPRSQADPFRILFVGQITQRKGISYLIDGFRRAAIPGSQLVLVGRIVGSASPWRQTPQVRHVPAVAHFDLPGWYQSADVYVLPSLIEGFPQTALEAMASGVPVVVSENTFGKGVITDGHEGYVVPIRDPDAIAERLQHLFAHPGERSAQATAARHRAEQFSWTRYSERTVAAVRKLD